MPARRFPPPWTVEDVRGSFVVKASEFAAECYRLAAETKNEAHEKILREMARAWSELAEELEIKHQ